MLTAQSSPLTLPLLLTVCVTALTVAGGSPRQDATSGSRQTAARQPVYFPPGQTSTPINYYVLTSFEEPSLFEAAKDARAVSYRATFFAPVTSWKLAVLLVVNPDGSGQISSSTSSYRAREISRIQTSVSAEDVEKFLQLVEKEGFWQMPSREEHTEQKTDAKGRKAYVLDGSMWMLEGVHNGSFHFVYRGNPDPNPILAMACYLAKDLAKPADPAFSMPRCASGGKAN